MGGRSPPHGSAPDPGILFNGGDLPPLTQDPCIHLFWELPPQKKSQACGLLSGKSKMPGMGLPLEKVKCQDLHIWPELCTGGLAHLQQE